MKISVVVPAYNEEKLIGTSLASIQAALASFHRLDWGTEIIVCDNNSTDRTAEIARAAGAHVVFEPINQISRARNSGAAAARGDWLVFVDADSYPSSALFADVAAQIQNPRCIAGGATVRLESANFTALLGVTGWNLISRINRWCAGSFIFCETAAFRQVGGFSLELFASEELDLSKKLKRLGSQTGRKLVILHRHPLLTSSRKLSLYSRSDWAVFFKKALFRPRATVKSREACAPWYDGRR